MDGLGAFHVAKLSVGDLCDGTLAPPTRKRIAHTLFFMHSERRIGKCR